MTRALTFALCGLTCLGPVACGGAPPTTGWDSTVAPDAGPDAAPDAQVWPERLLEICDGRDPATAQNPAFLTRGVNEITATPTSPLLEGHRVAAGFAPTHPLLLERLWLRLGGSGVVTVTVWGDSLGDEPDPDVTLVPERALVVDGEAWYRVEDFEPVIVEPSQRFWVGLTFSGDPVLPLLGPGPGGWDRVNIPGLVSPPQEWTRVTEDLALGIHVEGAFLCPVYESWFVDRRGEAGLAGADYLFLHLADLDGDGLDDLLGLFRGTLRVNRNLGGFQFDRPEEVTSAGVHFLVLPADVDNDGDQDVYLGAYEPEGLPDTGKRSLLLLNDGTGGLTPSPGSGLEQRGENAVGAFVDYDGDGALDLYVGRVMYDDESFGADALYQGRGDGTFEEVSEAAGLQAAGPGPTFGVTFFDVNDDGWPDALVAQISRHPNRLWLNGGDGTFTEVGAAAGVAQDDVGAEAGHTLMMECGDYDNDGHLDVMVGEWSLPYLPAMDPSRILRWTPGGALGFRFEDVTPETGIDVTLSMFDPAWADFDNDGHLDLVVCGQGAPTQALRLLRNNGDGSFTDVTYEAGLRVPDGLVAAWSDLDGDGDLDLVAYSLTRDTLLLFENRLGEGTRWIQLRLVGTPPSNRDALGARITATTGPLRQTRELGGAGGSRINGGSRVVHFGFGAHTEPIDLSIRWPSGRRERFSGLADNVRHTVTEGTGEADSD